MASILKKIGKTANVPYYTYECDTIADMNAIDVSFALMGSRCYVINTGEWFALNSAKEWKLVPTGGSTPEPGDSYVYDGGAVEGYGEVD